MPVLCRQIDSHSVDGEIALDQILLYLRRPVSETGGIDNQLGQYQSAGIIGGIAEFYHRAAAEPSRQPPQKSGGVTLDSHIEIGRRNGNPAQPVAQGAADQVDTLATTASNLRQQVKQPVRIEPSQSRQRYLLFLSHLFFLAEVVYSSR
jgi:hypothetical protein